MSSSERLIIREFIRSDLAEEIKNVLLVDLIGRSLRHIGKCNVISILVIKAELCDDIISKLQCDRYGLIVFFGALSKKIVYGYALIALCLLLFGRNIVIELVFREVLHVNEVAQVLEIIRCGIVIDCILPQDKEVI